MYAGGVTFLINKSFGRLQLVPEKSGLRLLYTLLVDGKAAPDAPGPFNILLPLEAIGGIWATTRAFLYGVDSLDENIIMRDHKEGGQGDTLIKLYRDKPNGENGKLTGTEVCWLRILTKHLREEVQRMKMGPKDLLCLELACTTVTTLAAAWGTHQTEPYAEDSAGPDG